jgi:hypothetical protein
MMWPFAATSRHRHSFALSRKISNLGSFGIRSNDADAGT